jgi:hypothetical protein
MAHAAVTNDAIVKAIGQATIVRALETSILVSLTMYTFEYLSMKLGLVIDRTRLFSFVCQQTICNNQGECECGRCKCHKDSGYLGPTCEDCPVSEIRIDYRREL